MLPIIDRLLVREVFKTSLAVSGILFLILVSNRLVRYLAMAADGRISGDVVFTLLGLKTISFFALLLAPAFFIGVLLTLGRMYRDHEITALASCGVGISRLYRGVFILVLPVALATTFLTTLAMPWAERTRDFVRHQQEEFLQLGVVTPGRFTELRSGRSVFYAESLQKDGGRLNEVFIQSEDGLAVAATGEQQTDPESGNRYLVLKDGYRYEGIPGQADYRVTQYEEYGVLIQQSEPVSISERRRARDSEQLWYSEDLVDQAELQWRFSMPMMVLILALIAVPLAKTSPREGRYGRLVVAILIYLLYANLLGVGRNWMERGVTPEIIGLWWVHGLFLLFAFALYWHETGGIRRPRRRAV